MLTRFGLIDGHVAPATQPDSPILVFTNPDESERRYLIDELKVDEHTLNSALDPDELSRLEFEPSHLAVIYKRPRNYSGRDQLVFKVASGGMFLFRDRLVILTSEDVPLVDGKPFARVQTLNELALKLIYRSIFHYIEHLRIFNLITDDLEKKINASMENRYLLNLFTLEKSLVYYLNAINTNGVLIEKLKNNGSKIGLSPEEMEFLDDMMIENTQCYRQAEIHSNILASLMDARASIVGNNLNVLMKTLNIITICIMVPTLVVSIFSMNVQIPLQQHPLAFEIIMGLAVLSVGLIAYIWKRKRW